LLEFLLPYLLYHVLELLELGGRTLDIVLDLRLPEQKIENLLYGIGLTFGNSVGLPVVASAERWVAEARVGASLVALAAGEFHVSQAARGR
jgi:hypothetical protein